MQVVDVQHQPLSVSSLTALEYQANALGGGMLATTEQIADDSCII